MIPRDGGEYSVQPRMTIKAFREVFQVPVADGIKVGMRFMLSPPRVRSAADGGLGLVDPSDNLTPYLH